MTKNNRIILSIVISITGLAVFHIAFYTMILSVYSITTPVADTYYFVAVLVHIALLILLLSMRDQFYLIPSDHKLVHVNIANLLTMYRLTSTPTILYLLILSETDPVVFVLLVFTSVAFLTDLLDGLICRKTGQTTRIGEHLDSMSDYAVLIVVSISFVHYGLISGWFFRVVLFRLVFQWLGVGVLMLYDEDSVPKSSFLGKVSIFVTMFLYAVAILQLVEGIRWIMAPATLFLEYAASAVLIVSTVEKALILRAGYAEAGNRRSASGKRRDLKSRRAAPRQET
jgi:cardiolipin synthase (CMP-forming)